MPERPFYQVRLTDPEVVPHRWVPTPFNLSTAAMKHSPYQTKISKRAGFNFTYDAIENITADQGKEYLKLFLNWCDAHNNRPDQEVRIIDIQLMPDHVKAALRPIEKLPAADLECLIRVAAEYSVMSTGGDKQSATYWKEKEVALAKATQGRAGVKSPTEMLAEAAAAGVAEGAGDHDPAEAKAEQEAIEKAAWEHDLCFYYADSLSRLIGHLVKLNALKAHARAEEQAQEPRRQLDNDEKK